LIADELKKAIAEDIVDMLVKEIELAGLEYTGQLKNSWQIKKEGDDVIVGSPLVWARVMDEGRLPGKMPPVDVLFPWVFQKIGGGDEKEIRRIAFAVAKKIAQKGIEPRHYVRNALFELEVKSR
jgi:hypothetical protein